ncbi:MAG TPA: translocation/assembly module TamB, partial [Fibrella sp.]
MRSFVDILLKTLLLVMLAFVTLWVMVQLPPVQTYLVQRAAKWATEKLGMQVNIGQASIKWFDTLTLEDVRIRDYQNRPMIQIGRLEVDYDLANFVDFTRLPTWLTTAFIKPGTTLRKPTNATHLDAVVLYKPTVQLVYSPKTGDLNLDDFIAAIERLTTDPATANVHTDMHSPFTIGKVAVVDGFFSMDDPREAYMKSPKDFDYNHLRLSAINGDVTNFLVLGDTIALDVTRLRTIDRQTGLTVKRMDTKFLYSAKKMEFANLYMSVNNSIIRDYVAFLYNTHSDLGDFNTRVAIRANFGNSIVRSADLGAFSEYVRGLNETWYLSGNMRGRVVDLSLVNTDLRFGPQGRSRLTGDLAFKGLPDMDNLLVNLRFQPSLVTMADIRQYYPDPAFNRTMAKVGTLAFNANFTGAFDDFTTEGQFSSALGRVAGKL